MAALATIPSAQIANNAARAALRLYAGAPGDYTTFLTRLSALVDGAIGGPGGPNLRDLGIDAGRGPLPQRPRLDVKRDAWAPRDPSDPRATTLTYLRRGASGEDAKVIDVLAAGADAAAQAATKNLLEIIGRRRFDTRLVRNIFFIVNVLRLTRLKLGRQLTQIRSVIASSHVAVSPSVTEYGEGMYDPNEVLDDQTYGGI